MVDIPASATLKRNTGDETMLLEASRKWLQKGERAPGLHASDLLDPRQAFWKHVDPQDVTDRQVPIFLIGRVLHSLVLGGLLGNVDLSHTDEGSRFNEEFGIWYSPDWDQGDVAEFKTTRSFYEPKTLADISLYVEQTLIYMGLMNKTRGKIWVLMLNHKDPETKKTTPVFRSYTLSISEEDLHELRRSIGADADRLRAAIAGYPDNPESFRELPLCRPFKCGAGECSWWERCQPEGRYATAAPARPV